LARYVIISEHNEGKRDSEMARIKETTKPSTLAQDYMREEIEKKKKEKKAISSG